MRSKPFKVYTQSMIRNFDYYANWLPGVPRELGDIGVIEDDVFRRVAHLEDLGIEFAVRDDGTASDIQHTSRRGVDISVSAGAGGAAGVASGRAAMSFRFTSTGAFVFQAKNVRYPAIKNLIGLQQAINSRLTDGTWRPEWRVVTELALADHAAVLISGSRRAEFGVEAEATNLVAADLTDASLGLAVTRTKDMHTQIIAQSGLTPIFRVHGLKRGGGAMVTRGRPRVSGADPDDFSFTEFTGAEMLLEDDE